MVKQEVIQEAINILIYKGYSDKQIIYELSHKYNVRKHDIEVILLGFEGLSRRHCDRFEGWLLRKEV